MGSRSNKENKEMSDKAKINRQLKKIGMSLTTGVGWYVKVVIDGQVLTVWADSL